jgi:hypothetical protein
VLSVLLLALTAAPVVPPESERPAPASPAPEKPSGSIADETTGDLGRVVSTEGAFVVIEAGRNVGLAAGMRVELLVDRSVDLGIGEVAAHMERVATGEVTAVGASRSQVRLDLDQAAPVGAVARLTRSSPPSLADAARPASVWHARLSIRPFIALGDTGFGDLSDAAVGYRFAQPVHLQLVLDPLGVAFGRSGDAAFGVVSGMALVSWDMRAFEVGLGPGVSTINNATTSSPTGRNKRDVGPGIAEVLRLGAVDGVNFTARSLIVLDDADHFAFASFHADLQAPVGSTTWLIITGAGGISQYLLLEAGMRVLVQGNGTQGSLFLTPTIGFAGLQADRTQLQTTRRVEAYGLAIGLGAEWRL